MMLRQILEKLNNVPNVPFYSGPIKKALLALISSSIEGGEIKLISNSKYGMLFRATRGEGKAIPVVLHAHLDHPGFVIKGGIATPIGSVFENFLSKSRAKDFDLDIFALSGAFIHTVRANVVKAQLRLAPNASLGRLHTSLGILSNLDFEETAQSYLGRSLDNHIGIALALDTLIRVVSDKTLKSFDLSVFFSSVEEVEQASTRLMLARGEYPGYFLDNDTQHLFLECSYPGEYRNFDYAAQRFAKPSTSGVFLRFSDQAVPYPVNGNRSFERLYASALALGTNDIQITPLGGRSDATPYVLFGGIKNIIGITMPCENVHNVSAEGDVAKEKVSKNDVETARKLLLAFCTNFSQSTTLERFEGLLTEDSKSAIRQMSSLRRYSWRIDHETYVVNSITTFVLRVFHGILSLKELLFSP